MPINVGDGIKQYEVYGDDAGFYRFVLPYNAAVGNNTTIFDTKAEQVSYNFLPYELTHHLH